MRDLRVSCTYIDMSLRRSERRKNPSPKQLSASKEPATLAPRATRTRKRKVHPALKDRTEAFLGNTAISDQPTKISAAKSKKRKLEDLQDEMPSNGLNPTPQDLNSTQSSTKTKSKDKSEAKDDVNPKKGQEKRLRRYRDRAPQSFLEKLRRAQTQRYAPKATPTYSSLLKILRMIVIGRTRTDTEAFPTEDIDIVGSTGNIYKVTIGQIPTCTCPDHRKGNECKHKVYAMHTVLKAPEHLVYQLAYLSSELREIFSGAPPIASSSPSSNDTDGNRKPIEGDCPICFQEMVAEDDLTWCKAACGNNAHSECWNQWAAIKRGSGATVTCVYCRTPWQADHNGVASLRETGTMGTDGYVNVAEQFGMSGIRDYSVYNRFSRYAMGLGWDRGDD